MAFSESPFSASPLAGTAAAGGSWSGIGEAMGWQATQFGQPTIPVPLIPAGWQATKFGTITGLLATPFFGTAIGFRTGQFGAPIFPYYATGFKATQFATPESIYPHDAISFAAPLVVLSIPSIPLRASAIAPTTSFGAPASAKFFSERWFFPSTRFGQPLGLTPQLQIGWQLAWKQTRFGHPRQLISLLQPSNISVQTSGFKATRLGTHGSTSAVQVTESGSVMTVFGGPKLRLSYAATGQVVPSLFGLPSISLQGTALAFSSGTWGTATLGLGVPASGSVFGSRFGTPSTPRPDIHKAYTVGRRTRVSQPSSTNRFNYPVAGLCGTSFGAPSAYETHHVWHIAPTSRFGNPLLRRTPLC